MKTHQIQSDATNGSTTQPSPPQLASFLLENSPCSLLSPNSTSLSKTPPVALLSQLSPRKALLQLKRSLWSLLCSSLLLAFSKKSSSAEKHLPPRCCHPLSRNMLFVFPLLTAKLYPLFHSHAPFPLLLPPPRNISRPPVQKATSSSVTKTLLY